MAISNRENLTPERIRGYSCPPGKGQAFFWDEKAPGLGIRATEAGAKSFIFEAKLNRQTIRITIGSAKNWPLESVWTGKGQEKREIQRGAREEANRLQSLIDQGTDPRQEKAEKIAEVAAKRHEAERAEVTVNEAWTAYIAERSPKWGEAHKSHHENFMAEGGKKRKSGRKRGEPELTKPGILRPFLALRLDELDANQVKAWLEREAPRVPTLTNQAYRALRAFIRWCADRPAYQGIVIADACNPRTARDTLPKLRPKDDCLQREQLRPWFEHVRQIRNPVISAFLQAALLTGARREELAALRWEEVDFKWCAMTIRDKVEGQRVIPLTPYVASILLQLPRRNGWVFSAKTGKTGRLQEPRAQHNKALIAGGLPALSIHGLRRSFGTLAEWVETPAGISAQIMGHKPSALAEKHYRRRPIDLLRLWHTKIEAWILEQAGIEQPKEAEAGLKLVSNTAA
jgi:integrase